MGEREGGRNREREGGIERGKEREREGEREREVTILSTYRERDGGYMSSAMANTFDKSMR